MDIYMLNENFETVDIVDVFDSFLWADRYNLAGDVELKALITPWLLQNVKRGYYVWIPDSEHTMIIDERLISTSEAEEGKYITYYGMSLEYILKSRIVWRQTVITGNLQNGIEKLLNENIVNPLDFPDDRRIDNFRFQRSTDPRITALTIDTQFTGQDLYEVVTKICGERGLGFKIIMNEQNQFVFSLYYGTDRSYAQEDNPYVIFSPTFDNLLDSRYYESDRIHKNVALIGGEGEGLARRTQVIGNGRGLRRKEVFIDARDVSSNNGAIGATQYNQMLQSRGMERMRDYRFITEFDGSAETTILYKYGVDFWLGDIIYVENEYDIGNNVRASEIIFSYDNENGYKVVPGFSIIEED